MNTPDKEGHLSTQEFPDDVNVFASGGQNKFREFVVKWIGWCFKPPYLPGVMIWYLLAVITTHAAVEVWLQLDGYWANPDISKDISFLGVPMAWGFGVIVCYLAYLLLMGGLLTLLQELPAFALWMWLIIFHMQGAIRGLSCNDYYLFEFMNRANCSNVSAISLFLGGIFLTIGLLTAGQTQLISSWKPNSLPPALPKVLRTFSIGWMTMMVFLVAFSSFSPGSTWKFVELSNPPPGRSSMALAYDTGRSVAVMFGGTTHWSQESGWGSVNDTWEWDGATWTEMKPTHNPPARYGPGAAYDESRTVTVLFGGSVAGENGQLEFFNDIWEWDGTDWTERSTSTGPSARQSPCVYYDPIRQAVVVYGGYAFDQQNQKQVFFQDAWAWDGSHWEQIPLEQSRATSSAAVIFDPFQQTPMILDGLGLWTLQGSTWVPDNFPERPADRWSGRMAFFPLKSAVILFGGFMGEKPQDDTWMYDGQSWRQVISAKSPPARNDHALFYDQVRGTIMMFGGINGGTFYQDMWELTLR